MDSTSRLQYDAYMESASWRQFRREALAFANYECARCQSTCNLEVHHLHYDTFGNEGLNDIEVLCRKCHTQADAERKYSHAGITSRRHTSGPSHKANAGLYSGSVHFIPRKPKVRAKSSFAGPIRERSIDELLEHYFLRLRELGSQIAGLHTGSNEHKKLTDWYTKCCNYFVNAGGAEWGRRVEEFKKCLEVSRKSKTSKRVGPRHLRKYRSLLKFCDVRGDAPSHPKRLRRTTSDGYKGKICQMACSRQYAQTHEFRCKCCDKLVKGARFRRHMQDHGYKVVWLENKYQHKADWAKGKTFRPKKL